MRENVTIRDVERELARLRDELTDPGEHPSLRTSAMTHIAWVPARWEEAAWETLEGLAERHPSRGILLFPHPEEPRDELDAEVEVRCFRIEALGRDVCAEVIAIRLNGARAAAPASIVMPLLIPDLPVFIRWRGEIPFGEQPLEQLLGIVDRLVVDCCEWSDPARAYAQLAELFDRVTVSDIAWTRVRRWREGLAALWPDVANAAELRVVGPEAEALLLAGWLRTRLGRPVDLVHEPAGEVELIAVDGHAVQVARAERRSASDWLSEHLDVFGRDRVYEEAVCAYSPVPT